MQLRKYMTSDCIQLAELFYQTVHSVNMKDYTKEQFFEHRGYHDVQTQKVIRRF